MSPPAHSRTVLAALALLVSVGCGGTFPEPREYRAGSNDAPGCGGVTGCGSMLSFCPSGRVDYLPGGDIVYRGTYTVHGSRVTVEVPEFPEHSPLVLTLSENEQQLGGFERTSTTPHCE